MLVPKPIGLGTSISADFLAIVFNTLALRKWRAFRYKNCARSQTAGVSKSSRRRSTKVNPFDIACLAVYLEQQMSSILSHHEDLPSILMMRIITRSLTAAGPPGSRLDFLILEFGKLTRNGLCSRGRSRLMATCNGGGWNEQKRQNKSRKTQTAQDEAWPSLSGSQQIGGAGQSSFSRIKARLSARHR